jgi:hypothetical protein
VGTGSREENASKQNFLTGGYFGPTCFSGVLPRFACNEGCERGANRLADAAVSFASLLKQTRIFESIHE